MYRPEIIQNPKRKTKSHGTQTSKKLSSETKKTTKTNSSFFQVTQLDHPNGQWLFRKVPLIGGIGGI